MFLAILENRVQYLLFLDDSGNYSYSAFIHSTMRAMPTYTAISFAPVQGFIEKSRKLRDLYGASLILSYLSQKIVEKAERTLGEGCVVSPGFIERQEGMPNRILVKGELTREIVQNTLLEEWQNILRICRTWVENNIGIPKEQYCWSQTDAQKGKEKGEWERWGAYTWEVFVGWGRYDPDDPDDDPHKNLIKAAMDDLETRKLKRDWVAVNWVGESSSLSGTDAIAWHGLGQALDPITLLTTDEKKQLSKEDRYQLTTSRKKQLIEDQELFYRRLSWVLDDPEQRKARGNSKIPASNMSLEKLQAYENTNPEGIGRYIAVNERLSIPELVKRLVTYDKIDEKEPDEKKLKIRKLKKRPEDPEFKDIHRGAGYWTGWFIGDGDQVGDKLKQLVNQNANTSTKHDQSLRRFSELVRCWGEEFEDFDNRGKVFPDGKGRVIYAGGDDFMGVLYSEETQTKGEPEKLKPIEAWNWLLKLPEQWRKLQDSLAEELDFKDENRFTYSVGFVWAGHQVPQRDVLQHCREAEKRSKSLGRDRLTIRVLFNSGQYVQWTCPWTHLKILDRYQDRVGGKNWAHLYNDWAHLKSRHAIRLREVDKKNNPIDRDLALAMLDLYFNKLGQEIQQAKEKENQWKAIAGDNSDVAIVQWVNDLVQVGWQLCSNT
ncbi:MAG: type III-B CRISPR-associated protein Cas10/Cmr2 [Leptolyngbyaceae bacterium]|nr:type III-B CRISPR-associated protein Cas10/Cmr2 [Leptolyngbyaceae bacterium]